MHPSSAPPDGYMEANGSLNTNATGGAETRQGNLAQMFCIAWKP